MNEINSQQHGKLNNAARNADKTYGESGRKNKQARKIKHCEMESSACNKLRKISWQKNSQNC